MRKRAQLFLKLIINKIIYNVRLDSSQIFIVFLGFGATQSYTNSFEILLAKLFYYFINFHYFFYFFTINSQVPLIQALLIGTFYLFVLFTYLFF